MKKLISTLLLITIFSTILTACGAKGSDDKTITVGASATPHAEILKVAESILKEQGYTLVIKEFSDYVMPNTALEDGELDANYFQHKPYLDDFNKNNGTHLVNVAGIHFEPLGIYKGQKDSLSALADGDTVAVPNDTTNEARALLLLQEEGLLTLKEDAGINATIKDIVQNPLNLKFKELDAAQIARALPDVAIGVINGNYALTAGLSTENDALVTESTDSLAAQTYANILVVKEGQENSVKTKALVNAVKSASVKSYIEDTYNGIVVPTF